MGNKIKIEDLLTTLKFNIFFNVMSLFALGVMVLIKPENNYKPFYGFIIIAILLLVLCILVNIYVLSIKQRLDALE